MERDYRYLRERLSERNANPGRADAIDAELWNELGEDATVMVSDMSGFTRITKKRGILHFLALHFKSVEIAAKLIGEGGGKVIKTAADNMISVFTQVEAALHVAHAINGALEEHNAATGDKDSELRLCFGISFGRILQLQDDVFGDPVNVAYKLGEDIAGPREVLISAAARKALPKDLNGFVVADAESARFGNLELPYHSVTIG